jgi:PAS domain S-box-containing protein
VSLAAEQLVLVEDNPGDAELIKELLSDPFGDVAHVSTLGQALEVVRSGSVRAVLLDLRLPDGSGVECVSAIRALAEELPIIVLTGLDDDAMAMSCLRAGAQEYLSKSEIQPRSLTRAIDYAITRASEGALRRKADALRAHLAAIVEGSPDAIVSSGLEGRITSWNAAATRIFEKSVGEAVGNPLSEVLPETVALAVEEARALVSRRTATGGAPHECAFLRGDGSQATVSLLANGLFDSEGAPVGIAAIARDVTQQRGLEAQLALSSRLASIGSLAAGVAHEINNPLAALMVNLELIHAAVEAAIPEVPSLAETSSEVRDARDAAQRVRAIVLDLRHLSRVDDEDGGVVDLRETIESALRIASNEIRHRAKVVRDYADVPPVAGNSGRIGQVVLNLILNAAQSIPEGRRDENELRVSTGLDERGHVTFTVSDSGSGMTPDVLRNVFAPFFTTKPRGVGTGLGLAISHRIVTALGGSITCESEVGRGSRFVVTLPGASTPSPAKPVEPEAPVVSKRKRVLVVDDERALLRVIQRVLGAEHDVTCVESAAEALKELDGGAHFDLVLCDVMMPQMTGVELYEEIRRRGTGLDERMVFMTGGVFAPASRQLLDRLPNQRIEKPFDARTLRELLAKPDP